MDKELRMMLIIGMYRIMISESNEEAEEVFRIVKKKLIDDYSGRVSVKCMDKIKTLLTMTLSIMRTVFRDSKKREV